jgi:NDP-sugar pyrophosphorylase family protein
MKSFILAAGLGTRLGSLTQHRPKALVEVGGMPLLEFALRKVYQAGCREAVVNVHHFADQIVAFCNQFHLPGLRIEISDERKMLLGTGGAIRHAAPLLDNGQPFLVYNTDVITDLDLSDLIDFHHRSKALATLAVRDRPSSRKLHFDHDWQLKAWSNQQTGEAKGPGSISNLPYPRSFSGIHVLSPEVFDALPAEGFFSIIDVYLDQCSTSGIIGLDHSNTAWMDAGKQADLPQASQLVQQIISSHEN